MITFANYAFFAWVITWPQVEENHSTVQQELSRLENYGYVMKKHEKNAGCTTSEAPMNFESYHKLSNNLGRHNIVWSSLLDLNKVLDDRDSIPKKRCKRSNKH